MFGPFSFVTPSEFDGRPSWTKRREPKAPNYLHFVQDGRPTNLLGVTNEKAPNVSLSNSSEQLNFFSLDLDVDLLQRL